MKTRKKIWDFSSFFIDLVGYERKYSGKCSEYSDFNWITTEKECEIAGKALGIQNPNPQDRISNGLSERFLTVIIVWKLGLFLSVCCDFFYIRIRSNIAVWMSRMNNGKIVLEMKVFFFVFVCVQGSLSAKDCWFRWCRLSY